MLIYITPWNGKGLLHYILMKILDTVLVLSSWNRRGEQEQSVRRMLFECVVMHLSGSSRLVAENWVDMGSNCIVPVSVLNISYFR